MRTTVVLDKKVAEEVTELKNITGYNMSELFRTAINELYLKEKRAKENLLFFVDLYNKGVVSKDLLFLLLPEKDAEALIIGSKTGKEAAEFVKNNY